MPLMSLIRNAAIDPTLFRYPSVGLGLREIVDRFTLNLLEDRPDGIIAHSLGCVVTWLAVHNANWQGPIVLLAPPLASLPATRLIPSFLRCPFAPLLDHRALMSDSNFELPKLDGCRIKTISGRFDLSVPLYCTHHANVEQSSVMLHTHNSMLFSASVAQSCTNWITNRLNDGIRRF